MTTTGYGDIHAVGQTARVLVSFAFVFDVVFRGLLGAEVARLADRRHRARSSSPASSRATRPAPMMDEELAD